MGGPSLGGPRRSGSPVSPAGSTWWELSPIRWHFPRGSPEPPLAHERAVLALARFGLSIDEGHARGAVDRGGRDAGHGSERLLDALAAGGTVEVVHQP